MVELNFKENRVQTIGLETLKETYVERFPVTGQPIGGIYHYDLLQWLLNLLAENGVQTEIEEIFAVNNHDRFRPGVSVINELVPQYGEQSPKVHCLRRVFANVELKDTGNDEWHLGMAVSYTQRGIAVGFGPHVKVCHNQTILSAEHLFSNYALLPGDRLENQAKTIDEMKEKIIAFLAGLPAVHAAICDDVVALQMRAASLDFQHRLVAELVEQRIKADSKDLHVRQQIQYALTNTQINLAVERLLAARNAGKALSAWDCLQLFNQDLKPSGCDVPQILPQCAALTKTVMGIYGA